MNFGEPMSDRMKAMRNLIAERAIKRGRKLTAAEQFSNLAHALYGDEDDEAQGLLSPSIEKDDR